MDWADIAARIEAGEDENTELKRTATDTKAIGIALSAFANTTGGLVVLGVADDGTIAGVPQDPDAVAERLTSFLQTGLHAPVQARLGRHEHACGWVHWIEVPRQRGFEPLRSGSRVYVRRGRASVEPSPSELQGLYNLFGYIVTEERAIDGAGSGDLDEQVFRDYLEQQGLDVVSSPQPNLAEDLRNRGAAMQLGDEIRATLYGVLAFGRRPQGYPQTRSFWVECVHYAGEDRASEPLQVAEAKGRIDEQVTRALGWFRGLGRVESYEGVVRRDTRMLPDAALREALVNAVAHRDYAILGSRVLFELFDNRAVVTSPGPLPNHMTPSSVIAGGHPRSRNELIANYLLVRGLMEARGRGWPKMRSAMLEHNGTEPELTADSGDGFVRVTLRTRPQGQH